MVEALECWISLVRLQRKGNGFKPGLRNTALGAQGSLGGRSRNQDPVLTATGLPCSASKPRNTCPPGRMDCQGPRGWEEAEMQSTCTEATRPATLSINLCQRRSKSWGTGKMQDTKSPSWPCARSSRLRSWLLTSKEICDKLGKRKDRDSEL